MQLHVARVKLEHCWLFPTVKTNNRPDSLQSWPANTLNAPEVLQKVATSARSRSKLSAEPGRGRASDGQARFDGRVRVGVGAIDVSALGQTEVVTTSPAYRTVRSRVLHSTDRRPR